MKMKKHGIIKKILLFVFVGLIFMILLLYILLGWMWVPRYRTGFNDSNDFAYKIGMSCHDTEYEYCTEIRYVYEKHGWSKKGGYVRYVDTQTHYNDEKRKYIESFQNSVEIYSTINDESKKNYNCDDIFTYNLENDGINQEFLDKNGIDSRLIDKLLDNESLDEYDLLCSYMYNFNVEVPGRGTEDNYFCVLYNDNTMSFIVLRHHKIVPE